MRLKLLLPLTVLGLLLPVAMWASDLEFHINDSVQDGVAGSTLTFHATLINKGATDLYLTGDTYNADTGLLVDDSPFFANFPLFLGAGESLTDTLFNVNLDAVLPPGDYFGSFTVQGGADSTITDALDTQNVHVTVGADNSLVPESNSLILLIAGALPLAVLAFKKNLGRATWV